VLCLKIGNLLFLAAFFATAYFFAVWWPKVFSAPRTLPHWHATGVALNQLSAATLEADPALCAVGNAPVR
jgi:hypothetical protein